MSQFRVLYRQFLFRAVDLELISKQADSSTLIGQFASLPIFVSMMLTLGGPFRQRARNETRRLGRPWFGEWNIS
jgi:hypothetical protein